MKKCPWEKMLSIVLCSGIVLAGCGVSGDNASNSTVDTEAAGSSETEETSLSSTSSTSELSSSNSVVSTSKSNADLSVNDSVLDPSLREGDTLTFEYFNTSMTVEWIQNIEAALETIGKDYNFKVTVGDANRDINTQLSQIDTAINQNIDGAFLFIVDEGSATAAVDKFNEAGIPVIGETLKLQDGNGKNVAPYVELDANGVGMNCGQWVVDNWKSTGVDLSDASTVGVIQDTNSKYQSDLARINGFMSGIESLGIPEVNVFTADCAAEASSTDNTEASYNQVSAIISAHPEITAWVVMGSVDSYAMGAARAIEAAGVQDNTILVSAGGELAIKEWDNGAASEWKATCYYDAMDIAEYMVEGMLEIKRGGKTAEEIYPDFKQNGQEYSAVEISGTMATPDNYKEVVS